MAIPVTFRHVTADRPVGDSLSFHGQSPARGAWLWVCLAAVALACSGDSGRADDSLGTIRLRLEKVGQENVKADTAPRLAVLLVDCSGSMTNTIEAEGRGQKRFQAVLEGLRKCLGTLAEESPGIEVRVRFFATALDCREQVSGRLTDASAVDAMMSRIPRDFYKTGDGSGTSLYQSTCMVIDQLLEEHRKRRFGWMLFGIFSDGKDESSRLPFNAALNDQRLVAFQKAGRDTGSEFATVVWTVGPEAKRAAASKAYGPTTIEEIAGAIPKPPPPRTRYSLVPAADQPTEISFKRLATHGRATLDLEVSGEKEVVSELVAEFGAAAGASHRLTTRKADGFDRGAVAIALELPQDVDVAKGVATTLAINASAADDAAALIEGHPSFHFAFLGTKTLPRGQWKDSVRTPVRKGTPAACSINPGDVSEPMWTFTGPDGQAIQEKGLAVEAILPSAGRWKVSFQGIADTGDPVFGELGTVQVVDADFTIDPPRVEVQAGDEATVRLVPAVDAPDAKYSVSVDGEPVAATYPSVSIPGDRLTTLGRHVVSVTAKSAVGGFEWTHDAMIDVQVAPRIEILSADYREGAKEAVASVYVAGELGDAIFVRVDDREPFRVPVFREKRQGKDKFDKIEVPIPVSSIGRTFNLEIAAAKEDACIPAKARVEGRPADIQGRLKSPLDGAGVSTAEIPALAIEPVGADVAVVGDVSFVIGFRAGGDDEPVVDGPTATRSTNWQVSLPPDLTPGPLDVFARPEGGLLRPEVFPEGKEWRKIGTLHIAPPNPWIAVVGAETRSGPTPTSGEAAALGPVHPGKPVVLQLRDVPRGDIEEIIWTFGVLEGDSQFEQPSERRGAAEDQLNVKFTPTAVGMLPVKVTVRIASGVAVPPALASLEVRADTIVIQPSLGDGVLNRASNNGAPSSKDPYRATGDVPFHPGIDGDFLEGEVAVFERNADAGSAPIWAQTFSQGTETVTIPSAAMPAVPWKSRRKDLEVRLSVRAYPGDPLHVPAMTPIPFFRPAPKYWAVFLGSLVAALVCLAALAKWLLGNELQTATLLFNPGPLPDPAEGAKAPATACELAIGDRPERASQDDVFVTWHRWRKRASVTVGLMVQMLREKSTNGSSRATPPCLEWISNKKELLGHRIVIADGWRFPFIHTVDGGNVSDGTGQQLGSIGARVSEVQGAYPTDDHESAPVRSSATYKLSSVDKSHPGSLYYRLEWVDYRDPYRFIFCAFATLAALLIVGVAWACNILLSLVV